jgi:DNA-binding response OmpR family regulator
MPVLDGPGMLARMREAGNKTPVLMLTSESKRSIVAQLMKLGIDDYILKPFKNDELKRKILKSLKMEGQALLPRRWRPAGGGGVMAPAVGRGRRRPASSWTSSWSTTWRTWPRSSAPPSPPT